jgi:hypothetical protein
MQCSLHAAVAIEKASGGLVKAEELLATKVAVKAGAKKKNKKKRNSEKNQSIA